MTAVLATFFTTACYLSTFGVLAYLVVGTLRALFLKTPKFPKLPHRPFGRKRLK